MAPSSPLNFAFPQNTSVPHTPLVQPLRPVVIEPLLIDTLAHDFKVEATYRANMHAFVDVRFLFIYLHPSLTDNDTDCALGWPAGKIRYHYPPISLGCQLCGYL